MATEPTNKRDNKPARGSSSELAPASWLEALAKELRANGSRHLKIGLAQNDQPHLAAGLVLDSLGSSIERTLWSASNGAISSEGGRTE